MHAYLLPGIGFGPMVIERLIGAIPKEDHDRAIAAGRFTPREIAAHMADWEPIMRGRIQQAVEKPGTVVSAFDEGQLAIDHAYSTKNIEEQIKLYGAERKATVDYVSALSPDELKQTVTHPERGVMSAEDLTGLLLGHDMYHVEQLTAYLGDRVASTW